MYNILCHYHFFYFIIDDLRLNSTKPKLIYSFYKSLLQIEMRYERLTSYQIDLFYKRRMY